MGLQSNRIEDCSDNACLDDHHQTIAVTISTTDHNNSSSSSVAGTAEMANPPMEMHRVCLPPHKTTLQKLKLKLSEIFFPDDPLHRFKNQTWLNKFVSGLQFLFPIFQWAPNYSTELLKSDIVSGLTIASLAIPQVIITSYLLLYTCHIYYLNIFSVFFFLFCRELVMLSLQICLP